MKDIIALDVSDFTGKTNWWTAIVPIIKQLPSTEKRVITSLK